MLPCMLPASDATLCEPPARPATGDTADEGALASCPTLSEARDRRLSRSIAVAAHSQGCTCWEGTGAWLIRNLGLEARVRFALL